MKRLLYLLFALLCATPLDLSAQQAEDSHRYGVLIEVQRAAISGVCIMQDDGDRVVGAIVNEFGVTAVTFSYDRLSGRSKIVNLLPQLDKWYIRRVLRRDIRNMVPEILELQPNEGYNYDNHKHNIRYRFVPIETIN